MLFRKFSNKNKTIFELVKHFTPKPLTELEFQIESKKFAFQKWIYFKKNKSVGKSIQFTNFFESMAFMNAVAPIAEASNHHPDWSNVYNRVEIKLRTHDINNISLKDMYLAKVIDIAEAKVRDQKPASFDDKVSITADELEDLKVHFK